MPNYKFINNTGIGKNKNLEKKRQNLNVSQLISTRNSSKIFLPYIQKSKKLKLSPKFNNQDELNKSVRLSDGNNMNFFDKFNIFNYNNMHIDEQQKTKKKKKQGDSELLEIEDIIKKDAQNLNQPELYYQNLFFNQIQKRKNNDYTFLPIKKNRNINMNLNIRRTSTSREPNYFDKKFGISLKKNALKSSLNVSAKFK